MKSVYLCRNKLIRRYKGKLNKIEDGIMMTMFRPPYELRLDKSLLKYF